jgi:hypothetical protein
MQSAWAASLLHVLVWRNENELDREVVRSRWGWGVGARERERGREYGARPENAIPFPFPFSWPSSGLLGKLGGHG